MNKMLTKILILILYSGALSSFNYLYSQTMFRHSGNGMTSDTIPFDGESSIEMLSNPNTYDDLCKVKVTYVSGSVIGTRMDTMIVTTCEYNKDTVITSREADLHVNNVLSPPAHIVTGDNSRAEITMPDGSVQRIGPNSDIQIEDVYCKPGTENQDKIRLIQGEIWSASQQAFGGDKVRIESGHAAGGPRGTIFTFEAKFIDGDTIVTERTYEGEVEVTKTSGLDSNITSAENRIKQLADDFKSGKITTQEYQQKAQEISKNLYEYNQTANKVIVKAGYQTIVKRNSAPIATEKFNADPNPWFQDSNFGK